MYGPRRSRRAGSGLVRCDVGHAMSAIAILPVSQARFGSIIIAQHDKNYVVREYTSKDWHVMDFREVASVGPAVEFLRP